MLFFQGRGGFNFDRMKIKYLLIICYVSLIFTSKPAVAQENGWGPWTPNTCWKGMLFRVKRVNAREWSVQFQNTYNTKVFVAYDVLPYSQGVLYQQHIKVNMNGGLAGSFKPGEISGNPYIFDQQYANEPNVYVVITSMNFGDTSDGMEAKCGENFNSQKKGSGNNNSTQVDYNDTASPALGPYHLLKSIHGIDIYSAEVKMGPTVLAIQFKLKNNNPFKAGIFWNGPFWLNRSGQSLQDLGERIDYNRIYGMADIHGFTDILDPGQLEEAPALGNTLHPTVRQFADGGWGYTNWLSVSTPLNDWSKRPLTFELRDMVVWVERGGKWVNIELAEQQETTIKKTVAPVPAKTTPAPIILHQAQQKIVGNSVDAQMQAGAQADIIKAQDSNNNAISQAMYLSNAKSKLAYEQAHGNNSATVQQLRQQIAELEKQQAEQNQKALQNAISGTGSTPATTDAVQNLMNIIDKNGDLESEKSNNKQEVKKSMSDFFKNVKFKTDSIKKP